VTLRTSARPHQVGHRLPADRIAVGRRRPVAVNGLIPTRSGRRGARRRAPFTSCVMEVTLMEVHLGKLLPPLVAVEAEINAATTSNP
jgi:hypothetical protein